MGLYERSLIEEEDQRDIVLKGPNRLEIQKDNKACVRQEIEVMLRDHDGSEVRFDGKLSDHAASGYHKAYINE